MTFHLLVSYLLVSVEHLVLQDHLAADLRAVVHNDVHVRPRAKLPLPVGDGGQRGDDEERPTDAHVEDFVQERDRLDCLPQTHFICQDAVFPENEQKVSRKKEARNRKWLPSGSGRSPVVPVEHQPVHSLQLVFSELVSVPVISGAIQLLPFIWRWAFLPDEKCKITFPRLINKIKH